jgi:hypothetical protein|tara:strand:- start:4013 stop:4465 length:453 start_codon:yes stop_codon:yes gene_type:complete
MSLQAEEQKISTIDAEQLDDLLEKEKIRNKGDVWIKLDKTDRYQRLLEYADKHGKEQNMSSKDLKLLKTFFKSCLDRNKLNKSKDVVYNKEERVIISIPGLHFNQVTKNFTLKILDNKRVSTLKSLTPKKGNRLHELNEEQQESKKEKKD